MSLFILAFPDAHVQNQTRVHSCAHTHTPIQCLLEEPIVMSKATCGSSRNEQHASNRATVAPLPQDAAEQARHLATGTQEGETIRHGRGGGNLATGTKDTQEGEGPAAGGASPVSDSQQESWVGGKQAEGVGVKMGLSGSSYSKRYFAARERRATSTDKLLCWMLETRTRALVGILLLQPRCQYKSILKNS